MDRLRHQLEVAEVADQDPPLSSVYSSDSYSHCLDSSSSSYVYTASLLIYRRKTLPLNLETPKRLLLLSLRLKKWGSRGVGRWFWVLLGMDWRDQRDQRDQWAWWGDMSRRGGREMCMLLLAELWRVLCNKLLRLCSVVSRVGRWLLITGLKPRLKYQSHERYWFPHFQWLKFVEWE